MLLGFSVENCLSFKEKTEFSMIATKEQQHGERVLNLEKYKNRILPISAIYGANASGKTNFIAIVTLIKQFILYGSRPDEFLPIQPHLLNHEYVDQPSNFSIGLLIDDNIYEYSFIVDKRNIIEEQLSEIKPNSNNSNVLFRRKSDQIEFCKEFQDLEFLKFIFKSTRSNQLFLTASVFQNCAYFKKIYDWFKNIEIINVDSTFLPFEKFFDENDSLCEDLNNYLRNCDIGIDGITCEEVSFNSLPLNESLKIQLEAMPEGAVSHVRSGRERFIVQRLQGRILVKRMYAIHSNDLGEEVKFNLSRESDGSLRAIDLFPAFSDLCSNTSKIYLIDEIDRSLHPLLVQHFIKMYLSSRNNKKRGQLIFTTHDINLIDQRIFRRDELWIVDRDKRGTSKFISFSDFMNVRKDKDIKKYYMDGRFGGVPNLYYDV